MRLRSSSRRFGPARGQSEYVPRPGYPKPAVSALITAAMLAVVSAGCGQLGSGPTGGGDPAHGREVIAAVECGACHTIPGIRGAKGIVGPPLAGFGERTLIAGIVPNQPDVLAKWVRDAPSLVPNTGMPDLPISEADSADVAAFLYTLR